MRTRALLVAMVSGTLASHALAQTGPKEVRPPSPEASKTQQTTQQTGERRRSAYYPNCDAARAAGVAPIYAGQPGYRAGLDRDGDGIACEPYRGR